MEEVDDDLVDFNAFLLIFPRDRQNFILRAVSQFALPHSHTVFREHRGTSGDCRIALEDLLRRVGNSDPIIHLFCRARDPLGICLAESNLSHGRVVPKKTIAHVRDHERNRDLGIALCKLKLASLEIHVFLLVLTHAKDLLAVDAVKFHIERKLIAADDALPLAVDSLQAAALLGERSNIHTIVLAKKQLFVAKEHDDACIIDYCRNPSIPDNSIGFAVRAYIHAAFRCFIRNGHLCPGFRNSLGQCPVLVLNLRETCCAHTQRIFSPCLNPKRLAVMSCYECSVINLKPHPLSSLPAASIRPVIMNRCNLNTENRQDGALKTTFTNIFFKRKMRPEKILSGRACFRKKAIPRIFCGNGSAFTASCQPYQSSS